MNRLSSESSPYLRQHADNPVDWYPWGDEAFEAARGSGRPILLSVGYAACHWCHVMAHESFEDANTAALMNERFVNIKVDREERPDVDALYMEAVQAVSGQGGWPMTVFLTPDGRPFFAGTYFPQESYAGRPGFAELLRAVDEAWRTRHDELDAQASELRDAIAARTRAFAAGSDIARSGPDWLAAGRSALSSAYDTEWGGFGAAPKFPQTAALELLLRQGTEESVAMVTNTLDAMTSGGVYDHIGGGFHRYSVDAFWMVPHFEKMLYDQAAITRTLVHLWQVTHEQRHRQVAEETVAYVLRDLATSEGAFAAAEDADSDGEEGSFYVWRIDEAREAIDDEDITTRITEWYGMTAAGNFEGANILHRPVRGDLLRITDVEEGRRRLLEARSKRTRPELDDKVVTEWNAMMVATLAEAGAAFGRIDWIHAAERAADFLLSELRDDKGRWYRIWHSRNGRRHLAYANDYAWLVEAFTRLGEATGRARWRSEAVSTADAMIELFWDEDTGGFFTVGHDGKQLVVRAKDLFDGATTSANSTAAVALIRLASLTGSAEYQKRAETTIDIVAQPLANHPTAFMNYLVAVDTLAGDATETVVVGDRHDLVEAVQRRYAPRNVLLWGEHDDSPLWNGRAEEGAYVCRNFVCLQPVRDSDELSRIVHANSESHRSDATRPPT